jgi:L-amino acid N-acyltransferase YncA
MRLRDAAIADLPAILEIYNATIPTRMVTAELEPVTTAERLPWFHEHSPEGHPMWVMEEEKEVAGWLSFSRFITRCAYRGTAEISVYVHENYRRRGVATKLLSGAIERGPALGFSAFVGLIFAHNEPSVRLFARFGFEKWGHLPRVARLDGVERDLLIFGLHLPAKNSPATS